MGKLSIYLFMASLKAENKQTKQKKETHQAINKSNKQTNKQTNNKKYWHVNMYAIHVTSKKAHPAEVPKLSTIPCPKAQTFEAGFLSSPPASNMFAEKGPF